MKSLQFQEKGFAAIVSVMAVLGLVLVFGGGFLFVTLSNTQALRSQINSAQGFYASESGVEDAIYRIKNNKNIGAQEVLTIGSSTATTTITTNGNEKTVLAEGNLSSAIRRTQVDLTLNTSQSDFYYGVQVGEGGMIMNNGSVVTGNVYSDGDITGSGTITGDAVVAGGIATTPTVSWTTNNANYFFGTTSANRDTAQSFTATASDVLNRVDVYLGKVGNPTTNITLRISNDNSGKPSTSQLASGTILYTSVGTTPSWISVAFGTPPNVVNGTKYWIVLDYNNISATDYFNWRKDSTDGYANNTGLYTAACCSGSPTWTSVGGDLSFQLWIGGTFTKIQGITVGSATSGTAHANSFVNATVHGSLCPNAYCIMDSQPQQPMPISGGVIQDWRDAATAGGTCVSPQCDASGNLTITNGASVTIGPKKITGNLTVGNNAYLTLSGTLWVQGNVSISNNCFVQLSPSYGANSGILLTDGTATVSNGCTFMGSGTSGSYIILLSAKNDPSDHVITVDNTAQGVIYYASNGRLLLKNNAGAKEATGYGIDLDNNATVTYESGLANIQFSSGPSAGFKISNWKEVP